MGDVHGGIGGFGFPWRLEFKYILLIYLDQAHCY